MGGKYSSIEEIENFIHNNPIPQNVDYLSDEEKEKFLKIVEDIIASYTVGGPINYTDFDNILSPYLDPIENSNDEEYVQKFTDMLMKQFNRINSEVLQALKNGAVVDEEFCNLVNGVMYSGEEENSTYDEVFSIIISQNKEFLKYYNGRNPEFFKMMIDNGIPFDNIINKIFYYKEELLASIYQYAIDKGYSYDELMASTDKLYFDNHSAITLLLFKKFPESFLKNVDKLDKYTIPRLVIALITRNDCNNEVFKTLFTKLEPFMKDHIADEIVRYDNVTLETVNYLYDNGHISDKKYNIIFEKYIQNNATPDIFKKYHGKSIPKEICDFMNNDNISADETLVNMLNQVFNDRLIRLPESLYSFVFKKIINQNPELVKLYMGYDFKTYALALEKGAPVDRHILINILLHSNDISEEDLTGIFRVLNVKPFNYQALRTYRGNYDKLIDSFPKIDYFLELLNIDRESFIQYAFASSYNWLESMIDIFDNNKIASFINIKNFFFQNYYQLTDNKADVVVIRSMIDLLKNYHNYPSLCESLINGNLSEEDIMRLKTLFRNIEPVKKEDGKVVSDKNDLLDVENIIFKDYKKQIELAMNSNDINFQKKVICSILFNMSYNDVKDKLDMYGSIEDLRYLLFNNRNNPSITNSILDMMVYVAMMEDIINCNNADTIINMLSRIMENQDVYQMCRKCNMLFVNFEEKMNNMYARELNANLTDLENIPEYLIDKKLTSDCGVRVIDLTDRKYCMIEHVMSSKESVETLVNGKVSSKQIFISLSLGSHRNQRLYYGGKSIIFASKKVPEELFIRSAISNIGSNGFIRDNSYEINLSHSGIKERGALETSSAMKNHNSEIICYREGLKFDYIILPGGRAPTQEEIQIAKEFNLEFVKVQELNKEIQNPKDISEVPKNTHNHQMGDDTGNRKLLSQLQELLQQTRRAAPRKIAIFTDSHGLFEPTLAILEDIRKSGITEIYSLGDDIGTGPNPKEVIDLLDAYGVKSIKGNHEIYATGDIESLHGHLEKTHALQEAQRNGEWTRNQLTPEQIAEIERRPDRRVVDIGGENVLLTHYSRDYNTEEKKHTSDDISRIYQGHVHFENQGDTVRTVRGAGIGGESGTARYIVLTEKPEGGYEEEVRTVKFNVRNTKYDIIESDMADQDKQKISSWIGDGSDEKGGKSR